MEDFIPAGYTRLRITNNSFCCGCEIWFDDEVPRRQDLIHMGDEEKGYNDFHPECIEKPLAKGVLYYPEEGV